MTPMKTLLLQMDSRRAGFARVALSGSGTIDFALKPARSMAWITALMFDVVPEFHRTLALLACNETAALSTPGTLWIASVTWRAQLLQVIPLTAISLRRGPVGRELGSGVGEVVCIIRSPATSNFSFELWPVLGLLFATKHQK